MNVQHPDIKIRYIRTKNKTRKLVTYSSDDCELRVRHKRINDFIEARFIPSIFSKGYVKNRSIYHNALAHLYNDYFRFLYKGIIIKHNKTEPTYTKTSLFLCEKRRFFMARTEKGVVMTI